MFMRTRNLTHTHTAFLISHWSMNTEEPFESIHGTWQFRRQHCHRSNKWDRYCDCWRSWSGKILSYKPCYDVKAGNFSAARRIQWVRLVASLKKVVLQFVPSPIFGTLSQELHWGLNTMTTNWDTQLSERRSTGGCLAFCDTHTYQWSEFMCFQKHVTYFLMDVFVLSFWLLRIRRIRIWSSQWLRSDAALQVWSLKMSEQLIPSLWLGLALPCLNSSMVLAHFEKFVLEKQRRCRHWALGSCLPKATWMCRCCLASKGKLLLFRQRETVAIG